MLLPHTLRLRLRLLGALVLLVIPTWCLLALEPDPTPQKAPASKLLVRDLQPGVRLEVDGKPIDSGKVGHAAPFVGDFDGDGVNDLLVGQFENGILRIYRNTGTNAKPKLAAGVTFMGEKKEGRVPTG